MKNIKLFEEYNDEQMLIEGILVDSIIMVLESTDVESIDEAGVKQALAKFQKKKKNLDANKVKAAVSRVIKGDDSPLQPVVNKLKKFIRKEAKRIAREMKVNPQRVLKSFDKIRLDLT